jgi:hypothetical protein
VKKWRDHCIIRDQGANVLFEESAGLVLKRQRRPSDPHHLRLAQSRALGRKVSDEFTVPLCRAHHREVHRCGNEGSWWQKTGIEPLAVARALWLETHPLGQWEPPVANNEGS